jgi:hypothetical protein
MTNSATALALMTLLAGAVMACSDMQQPLVFVSENSVGIDIGVSPAETQTVKLNLGYKGRDTSFVPVTVMDKTGQYHPVRGCYRAIAGDEPISNCELKDLAPNVPGTKPAEARAAVRGQPDVDRNAAFRIRPVLAPNSGDDVQPKGLDVTKSEARQSMIDSLSVFSSFNTDARAGTQTDVGLGKVFATGIAAQQLTEGQNYYLQYKGQALRYAVTECLNALVKAKGEGKVTEKEVMVCTSAPSSTR